MRITREKRPSMALPVVGLIMTCGASLGLLAVSEYRPADRQVRLLLRSARIIAGHIFRRATYAGNCLEPADAAPLGASSRQADQLAYQAVISGSYPWLWAPNLTPKPAPHGQHAG